MIDRQVCGSLALYGNSFAIDAPSSPPLERERDLLSLQQGLCVCVSLSLLSRCVCLSVCVYVCLRVFGLSTTLPRPNNICMMVSCPPSHPQCRGVLFVPSLLMMLTLDFLSVTTWFDKTPEKEHLSNDIQIWTQYSHANACDCATYRQLGALLSSRSSIKDILHYSRTHQ